MSLQDFVQETFALNGVLSYSIEEFTPRDEQSFYFLTPVTPWWRITIKVRSCEATI